MKRVDLVQFRTVGGGGVGCETFPELIERGYMNIPFGLFAVFAEILDEVKIDGYADF